MADDRRTVTPGEWVSAVTEAAATRHVDWLSVVDELGRSDELRVVVRLLDPTTGEGVRVETSIPRDDPELPSLAPLLPGLAWHEREAQDLFGVRFAGGDPRPLLVAGPGQPGELHEYPLRKDAVLAARVALPWPGAAEETDTTRRRMAPPGVPDPDVFGARPPDAPPLDPTALTTPSRRRR